MLMGFNLEPFIPLQRETKTGDRISHLINLVGITENKWNSAVNTTEKLTNIQAFVPLGKITKDQAEHASIYWATPDAVEGKYNINLETKQMFIMTEGWPMDGDYRCSKLRCLGHALCQTQ